MDVISYLIPKELFAQIIVFLLCGFFLYWLIKLLVQFYRLKSTSSQLNRCQNISELSGLLRQRYFYGDDANPDQMKMISAGEAGLKFGSFCKSNQIPENSPIYKHLTAIFFTGFNENQLNVETLLKNTVSRIIVGNTMLRYLISLFIIIGLLGTLSGLAGSLYELSAILPDAQLTDETLKTGLKILLGKLSGAFTPSLVGVLFTVLSMGLFARLQKRSYQIIQLLEHETLTNWVPNLIPTPSQRMLEKLNLGEKQIKQMAEFTAKVSSETDELRNNIKEAGSTLKEFTESAAKLGKFTDGFTRNLDEFAQKFKESVHILAPVTESMTGLYQRVLEDSQKLKENVRQTLDDSQTFRGQVHEEFNKQTEQAQMLLGSLKLYETSYIENRQSTDEKIQTTLSAAEEALKNLSRQNELFVKEFESVGVTLRGDLKNELINVTATLNQNTVDSTAAIIDFSKNVGGEIQSVSTKLGNLDDPIKKSADFIEATSKGFDTRTQKFLDEIRREFQNQNQQKGDENVNLANLNDGIQTLVNGITALTGKIEKLNQKEFGQPNYRERQTAGDMPRTFDPDSDVDPNQGVFSKIFGKFK